MPVVSHHTINGRMVAVTMTAQVSLLPDALGSVAATAYDAAAPDLQLRATPYGSALMGSAGWLRYSWVGLYGYRRTDLKHAEMYVRARHYSTTDGIWTSADPLWPDESAYGYVEARPLSLIDPSGYHPCPSSEVDECKRYCAGAHLSYGGCEVVICAGEHGIGGDTVGCWCNCPNPPVSFVQSLARGTKYMHSLYGKCKFKRAGDETNSNICPGGTHQTYTYQCGKKEVTVSITCCPCDLPGGKDGMSCFSTVKAK